MANKKSKDFTEEVPAEVVENTATTVAEEVVAVEEKPMVIEEPKPVKKEVEREMKPVVVEVVSLDPYEVRPAKTGAFIEKLGSDSIFETEDGKRWAIPYKAEHASLKKGDQFTF